MVSHPLRATPAAASHSALTGARASLAREPSPARPACGLAQRRTPAGLTPCPHTAPRFAQPLARRLHARLPPRIPSSDEGLRGPEETRGGLLPQNSFMSCYGSISLILANDHTFSTRRAPPNACEHVHRLRCPTDRMRPRIYRMSRLDRSPIACLDPRPRIYINQKYTHALRHAACVIRHNLSRASRARLPPYGYVYRSHRSSGHVYVALRPRTTVALLTAVTLAPRPDPNERCRPPCGDGVPCPPIRGRGPIDPPQACP